MIFSGDGVTMVGDVLAMVGDVWRCFGDEPFWSPFHRQTLPTIAETWSFKSLNFCIELPCVHAGDVFFQCHGCMCK